MILKNKDFKKMMKILKNGGKIEKIKFNKYTNLEFASDIFSKIGKYWYISSNDDNLITIDPTILSEEYEIWQKRNHSLKWPYAITKEWLKNVIFISESVKNRYPKLTEKLIADQLYKYCNKFDLLPLKGINIYDNLEWENIYNTFKNNNEKFIDCMGFCNIETGNVYINIDSDYSLWGLLCHEIRHIGLDCNPLYYNITEKEREEESVLLYGESCAISFNWNDKWINY